MTDLVQPIVTQGQTPPSAQENQPGPVPYDRFKQVNDELKTMREQLAAIEAERKKAGEKQLAEQQEWQKLAEQREAELKAERTSRLRLQVAASKGLPVALADKLTGDDETALGKDADALLALITEAAKSHLGPGVPPATSGGKPVAADINTLTPAEIRAKRDELLRRK